MNRRILTGGVLVLSLAAIVGLASRGLAQQRAPRGEVKAPDVIGKVVAVAKDGKSFTVDVSPKERGEEPKKVEIKIGDKTVVRYHAVAINGAKPTEGYVAAVRWAEGAKELAGDVAFRGAQGFRNADIVGKVASVGKDGKSLKIEERPTARGEAGKTVEIKLTDKTQLTFSNVGKDQAKPADGMFARVWLVTGVKDTADSIGLDGQERGEERGGPPADVTGRVAAVAKDQKSVTLTLPGAARGEAPKKEEIKLGDKTALVFQNVGPNEAKVADGQFARIWLEKGSKEAAAKAVFMAPAKETGSHLLGRVVGVGKDGKSVTLESAPGGRGEEAKKHEVKIGDTTRVSFNGVGPDEAKLVEGLMAFVRLEDGSKDKAVQIMFSKPGGERGRR